MEPGRILLRRSVALALFGDHVDQDCMVQLLRLLEGPLEQADIMAVHRP